MTKEDIQKVLDLSLEYYKLEVFGTDKESQPPTQERIDYIYERIQPSLPSNLDEAAGIIVAKLVPTLGQKNEDGSYVKGTRDYFSRDELIGLVKAGAEWMAGQGVTVDGIITKVGYKLDVETTEYILPEESEFERGDKVIVQIRKKQ